MGVASSAKSREWKSDVSEAPGPVEDDGRLGVSSLLKNCSISGGLRFTVLAAVLPWNRPVACAEARFARLGTSAHREKEAEPVFDVHTNSSV